MTAHGVSIQDCWAVIDRPYSRSLYGLLLLLLFGCQPRINPYPTFSTDIAPIIFKNCAPCHRPGEVGPFPLLTYEDVAKHAKDIARVTQARYMPPWPADPSYSHFIGERVLKASDIETIQRRVVDGAPAGDPAKLPPPPEF